MVVIVILLLFLVIFVTLVDVVLNVHCNDGTYPIPLPVVAGVYVGYYGPVPILFFDYGCNCPNSTHTGTNGHYGGDSRIDPGGPFNYTTCTGFGGDHNFIFGNNATDCCNFCCDRNDPYPGTTSVSGN